jgi:hypothetical protein
MIVVIAMLVGIAELFGAPERGSIAVITVVVCSLSRLVWGQPRP